MREGRRQVPLSLGDCSTLLPDRRLNSNVVDAYTELLSLNTSTTAFAPARVAAWWGGGGSRRTARMLAGLMIAGKQRLFLPWHVPGHWMAFLVDFGASTVWHYSFEKVAHRKLVDFAEVPAARRVQKLLHVMSDYDLTLRRRWSFRWGT